MINNRIMERVETHRRDINGKTTEEIAKMISLEGVREHNTPQGRALAEVLRRLGYERRQTSRSGVLVKVWRAPVEITFSDEAPV